MPDNANVRHIDSATPEMARPRDARTFDIPPGCIFRQNVGMGDCFFLCVEQDTGYSVSSQRVLLATQMNQEPMAIYRTLLLNSEDELTRLSDAKNSGEFVPTQAVTRAREIVGEMEFCRGATDSEDLRSIILKNSYWADSFAVEGIQVLLNVKAIVISSGVGSGYVIKQESAQRDVVFFEPDLYFAVKLECSHYELMADESGKTAFQYAEIPRPIRACLLPV